MIEFLSVILTWPVVVAVALFWFRGEIKGLLTMLQKTRRASFPNGAVVDFATGDQAQRRPAETIQNKTFLDETVEIDGKTFVNCRFENVILKYSGEEPFSLQDSQFHGSLQFLFAGAAANAVEALTAMYAGFGELGRQMVEMFFDSIRNPRQQGRPQQN